jgi:hypothetical protein
MLEEMSAFFETRIDGYDGHMLSIPHIKNGYKILAEIYKRFPDIKVTGIDLSQKMLDIIPSEAFPTPSRTNSITRQ